MTVNFNCRNLGRYGEQLAAMFLLRSGYRIVGNNWRCPRGEADLIAWDGKSRFYVFCEVKTRRNLDYGHPLEAISHKKLRTMLAVAGSWTRENFQRHQHHRLDVLSVHWSSDFPQADKAFIEHLKGVFVCH